MITAAGTCLLHFIRPDVLVALAERVATPKNGGHHITWVTPDWLKLLKENIDEHNRPRDSA